MQVNVFKKGKKKDPRNYRLLSHTSVPGLETISRHMKDRKTKAVGIVSPQGSQA